MESGSYDVIVVGQGLAGTTLAWTLRSRRQRVLVIDQEEPVTASRIAAGLITPITGPRLAITWNWEACWPRALSFYRKVEQMTGSSFFHQRPAVRLFANEGERENFQSRLEEPEFRRLVRQSADLVDRRWFEDRLGGFEMSPAAQLDVSRFLDVSRRSLQNEHAFLAAAIDPLGDVVADSNGVRLTRWNLSAKFLIFCQGFTPVPNAWFERVRFNPSKGEILTLQIPGLTETRSIHRGIWIAPRGPETYLVGSTFEWGKLDQSPTPHARTELMIKLAENLRAPEKIVGHQAAVRPTMRDFRPVVGLHQEKPRLGIFNGLGTRGALLAPWLAERFTDLLTGQGRLDPEWDVSRWFR